MNSGRAAAQRRRELADRLREKAAEIEEEILDRITARELADSPEGAVPHGTHTVVNRVLEYGIAVVELGERRAPSLPPVVIANARNAVWRSVPEGTIRGRYFDSYSLFKRSILREHDACGVSAEDVSRVIGSTDIVFRELEQTLEHEYAQELENKRRSPKVRELERVEGLLSGELIEAPELEYDFNATHVGLVGSGADCASAIRGLAKSLDGRPLLVYPSPAQVWGWISCKDAVDVKNLARALEVEWPQSLHLAIGEPATGLTGWRLTHRQAKAAFPITSKGSDTVVKYAEVILLASTIKDYLLVKSLREVYLGPLAAAPGGAILYETLQAYIAADRCRTSSSIALGVTRQTVTNRLQRIEGLLGQPLAKCIGAMELALQLKHLRDTTEPPL